MERRGGLSIHHKLVVILKIAQTTAPAPAVPAGVGVGVEVGVVGAAVGVEFEPEPEGAAPTGTRFLICLDVPSADST